jgi:DNA-directed RNA polymerase specialized sigma24 family protein
MRGGFEELVASVKPRLERALVAAYGPERGEEAVAEAMAWAWEHRDRLMAMGNPAGYLYRVGQSRSRPRTDRAVAFPPPSQLGVVHVEPALPSALAELTERQRVCVALVVGHHWSYEETADVLEISKSSVQSHVERGLARLRERLGVIDDVDA